MTKAQVIKYSLIGLFSIGGLLIVLTFIKNNRPGIDYKELVKAKDETIKAIQGQRDIYKELNEEKDRQISEHEKKDSILLIQAKQLKVIYEKIPVYINSLDRDGLRSAGERAVE